MTCTRVYITCSPRCLRRPADATMTKLISYSWFRCFFVFFGTSRFSMLLGFVQQQRLRLIACGLFITCRRVVLFTLSEKITKPFHISVVMSAPRACRITNREIFYQTSLGVWSNVCNLTFTLNGISNARFKSRRKFSIASNCFSTLHIAKEQIIVNVITLSISSLMFRSHRA